VNSAFAPVCARAVALGTIVLSPVSQLDPDELTCG
jgi:hypothetical protein